MIYNNDNVRRRDRLLDEQRAKSLLEQSEYGVMSLSDANGEPYGIPMNFVWDGESSLYLHCAPVGRKLQIVENNQRVSFCIVGNVKLAPEQFTTAYESVVLKGTIHVVTNDEERWHAIDLLLRKLSPNHTAMGMKRSERSFKRVAILRIDIAEYSGKRKRIS